MHSCTSTKDLKSADHVEKTNTWNSLEEGILFLNFKVYGDSTYTPMRIEIANSIIRDGRIKEAEYETFPHQSDDLVFIISHANQTIMKSLSIRNPLISHMEYAEDDGKLMTKKISVMEKEYFLRIQLTPGMKTLQITTRKAMEMEDIAFLTEVQLKTLPND